MIIDCHNHVASSRVLPDIFFGRWSENIKRQLAGKLSEGQEGRLDELFRQLNHDPDCAQLLREMNVAGIDKAVLLVVDFGLAFDGHVPPIEELLLDHKRIIDDNPGRFIGFAGVDPRRGQAGIDLFERAVVEWGFRGLKLYPPCGYSPSDPLLFPYYEICRQHKLPVLTHVGPTSPAMSFKHTAPSDVDEAAFQFPEVNFILGHAGAMWYREAGTIAEYRPNIYLDLSGFQSEVRKKTFPEIMAWHATRGLTSRLLFGTDWPIHRFFGGQKKWVDEIRKCESDGVITKQDLDCILYRNAARILNIEEPE